MQAGQDGLSAGFIARKLGLPASSLPFHLMHLQTAVTQGRAGRSLIYAVNYDGMNGLMEFLTDNCCAGVASNCAPAACTPAAQRKSKSKVPA